MVSLHFWTRAMYWTSCRANILQSGPTIQLWHWLHRQRKLQVLLIQHKERVQLKDSLPCFLRQPEQPSSAGSATISIWMGDHQASLGVQRGRRRRQPNFLASCPETHLGWGQHELAATRWHLRLGGKGGTHGIRGHRQSCAGVQKGVQRSHVSTGS